MTMTDDSTPSAVDETTTVPTDADNSPFPPPVLPTPTGDETTSWYRYSRPRPFRAVALVTACAVAGGGAAWGVIEWRAPQVPTAGVSFVNTAAANPPAGDDSFDLHSLLDQVMPAVLAIAISSRVDGQLEQVAAGSGVVISADGLVLTNAHVVDPTDSLGNRIDDMVITVKMADGTVRSAEVLGRSPAYDVALLQLDDASGLTPLSLADSTGLQVGDRVVAIGNALDLGDEPTVSTGIISALGRSLEVTAGITLHDLIQTDAAINHGNSGGALVNNRGELVGINSAGIPNAQNVGFAISVGTIQPLLERLKAGEQIDAAPIGFIGITLNETPDGLRILDVGDGTPADSAGLQADDYLRSVDGTPISTSEQLGVVLRRLGPGAEVEVTVERDGSDVTVTMTLAERPAD
ncbi:MAG: S1C family serine protease [Ilumatobacteraceae bacterium]